MDPTGASSLLGDGVNETVRAVAWSPEGPASELEVMRRVDLLERFDGSFLARPERVGFHLVLVCCAGRGTHQVDGIDVVMEPRTVVHVEPGQISQWNVDADYDAWMILAPALPGVGSGDAVGPRLRHVDPPTLARVETLLGLVSGLSAVDLDRRREERALRTLLLVALGLTTPDPPPTGPYADVYQAFQADVEARLDVRESINDRAARLGYSARTLTRAAEAFTGNTAKHEADQRLGLEARRLLAVPDFTVTAIAATLGFSEPTNFAKFVRRVTGRPPAAWRR